LSTRYRIFRFLHMFWYWQVLDGFCYWRGTKSFSIPVGAEILSLTANKNLFQDLCNQDISFLQCVFTVLIPITAPSTQKNTHFTTEIVINSENFVKSSVKCKLWSCRTPKIYSFHLIIGSLFHLKWQNFVQILI
jgi:hypothetical protein